MGKEAPKRRATIFGNFRQYIFKRPPVETLVAHDGRGTRQEIGQSILQRTGIDITNYRMLNLHRIGIDAPASYVFDELMKWNGDSICWPNQIAKVTLVGNTLDKIKIYLFGINFRLLGFNFFHLFDLNALRIQKIPASSDLDNARYLLYECKGGYPIGVFSMYTRSSIPERGEKELSQLFLMVSFNFYGKSNSRINIFNKVWERIHNRATSNIMYRFKQLCEWKFESFTKESDS